MSRYETTIDLDNPNNSQTQLITLVGHDQVVLDVGCAAGDTAAVLKSRGCTVSGVDIDPEAAEPARAVVEQLVIADIDRNPLSEHFDKGSFDAIIFGDVLEHLMDPWSAVRDAVTLLRPGGRIVVSIPNVAHAAVRLALLQGRWDYTDKGLLDRTHVRFFTLEAVCELLEGADLQIEVLTSTVLDPLAVQEIDLDAARLPAHVVEWVRQQPDSLNYQYVASARPLAPGEERTRRPDLRPALAYDQARLRDVHTQRMDAERQERHDALTQRDHIIGLQRATQAAENRYSLMRIRTKRAEKRYRQLRADLDEVIAELGRLSDDRKAHTRLGALADRLRRDNRKRDAEIDPIDPSDEDDE